MHLIDMHPRELAAYPGFDDSVALLRAEAELPMFADGEASYDVEQYAELADRQLLVCMAVVGSDGVLLGWALALKTTTPRRSGIMYVADVMWSATPQAGGLLLMGLRKAAGSAPLFITASRGGRLDKALSRRREPTHHVFLID